MHVIFFSCIVTPAGNDLKLNHKPVSITASDSDIILVIQIFGHNQVRTRQGLVTSCIKMNTFHLCDCYCNALPDLDVLQATHDSISMVKAVRARIKLVPAHKTADIKHVNR